MKWIKYVQRAFALASLLAVYVPMIMADGKITIDELVSFAQQVCEIGNWKLSIDLPDDVKDIKLDALIE